MSSMYQSMSEVRANHPEWFSPGAMRFFASRIESGLLAGRWFITSEKFEGSRPEWDGERLFSVREVSERGIDTVGDFQAYKTKEDAYRAVAMLKKAAGVAS